MLPPIAPPALPAPESLGALAQPIAEAPLTEACLEVPANALNSTSRIEDWTVEKVVDWLTTACKDLSHLSQRLEEHRITGDVLLELTSSDLEEIGIHALGDKKRLLKAVAQLKAAVPPAPCQSPPPFWQAPAFETTSPFGACSMPSTPPPSFDA
jgi:hypothetical protein